MIKRIHVICMVIGSLQTCSGNILQLQQQLDDLLHQQEMVTLKPKYISKQGYASVTWHPGHPGTVIALQGAIDDSDPLIFKAKSVIQLSTSQGQHSADHIIADWLPINTEFYALSRIVWRPPFSRLTDNMFAAISSPEEPVILKFTKTTVPQFVAYDELQKWRASNDGRFLPQFWLYDPQKKTWKICSIYGDKVYTAADHDDSYELSHFKLPFTQERDTVIQYITCDDKYIFGLVAPSRGPVTFDIVIMNIYGNLVQTHNLCGGIIKADVQYNVPNKVYSIAYTSQRDPTKIYLQRFDAATGAQAGTATYIQTKKNAPYAWRTPRVNDVQTVLMVIETEHMESKMLWYTYDTHLGSITHTASDVLDYPQKTQPIRLLPDAYGTYFAVYCNDTSFAVYSFPSIVD